ncbi:hypothetical protein A3A93_04725 [Candidatus Roizmanbacteria bacterium RIFCSPLOWO2_01_FULL_38_12]|uniref:PAS domain-containing protein n=1 Tax=Candidatus Roizmanbacteria bacterium RIFCSPLOWO2_01_FULL_38_12 TaxID=1802061 RepID=A0A1F7ITM3_9BACT|nr:MAG: hypothetical protein A3F59_02140 [Candidatus Roizmanbacteria bacterium RIFCSPHIGHO2_12_FULL_38_13]OGK46717.1 MAG: hypothetical protein A3A93_04725 [Candidatus Roizmanbacteria bacterium RIFCSPLOWO2_01_FULL_38_12]
MKTGNTLDADEIWNVAWTYISSVVDTLHESFLVLNKDLKVISANRTFYIFFQVTKEETEGKKVYELGNRQWDIPKLKVLLEDILPNNTFFEGFKVEHKFSKIGLKIITLNARRIYTSANKQEIILLAMNDVTKEIQLEEQLREYVNKLHIEVARKTAALEERVNELEMMNKQMVGRELKMIELKNEIEKLKKSH